ncbi:hypothetical protein [Pasteurella canis]|uniref:hypothetical protein n=1 Tax=Pasteurella canis TaxID=753 RepID=UPI00174653AE|nr:hypothetical protein [Pasteurella canis]
MVRHVKLARDRRRKKLQIKVMIFFSAILLIITGILLRDKKKQLILYLYCYDSSTREISSST